MRIIKSVIPFACMLLLAACSSRPTAVPTAFAELSDSATIFPDYSDVTIPPNIAPLNIRVSDEGATEFVVEIGDVVAGATADGKTDIDSTAWRQLLEQNRGKDIAVHVYAHRPAGWVRFSPYTLHVAEEPIDGFLAYRLIEPGYELYRQLGLYQRNLTNFDEAVIYENNRTFTDKDNHCINCHNFQNYSTDHMLFHVRASHGGTVIVNGSEAHKIAIKHDSIIAAGVYPSWHPTLPLVAFSTNKTGQVFHMYHEEKIEVLDVKSDLLLYDVERNSVSHIIRSGNYLETFPCWAPDGKRLYFCRALLPFDENVENLEGVTAMHYDSLFYDIYSMSFDPDTRTFGELRLEVDASSQGHSTSVPRISPDGRYLLYTQGDYGQFHIWHNSADLWVKALSPLPEESTAKAVSSAEPAPALEGEGGGEALYPLTEANSAKAESYHSWSSNGRWIAFASRRIDAAYSRVFIAYFDKHGHAHKAFLLPQRDPDYNTVLLKSYNVPELTKDAVQISTGKLNHIVYDTEAELASYEE